MHRRVAAWPYERVVAPFELITELANDTVPELRLTTSH